MIAALVGLALTGLGGYAFGRGRAIGREQELQGQLANSVPLALPASSHREPLPDAVLLLPQDAEDFTLLRQAVCDCYAEIANLSGGSVDVSELRDCLLAALYPEFAWPPVPGDAPEARLMWLIADHEARTAVLGQTCVDPGEPPQPPGPRPAGVRGLESM
jgi:hypothetical protein